MKKKILLIAVIAAMLICTLAIAVSAEGIHNSQTVNFNETVTLRDGTVCNLFDENGNALIWFRNLGVLQSVRADDTDSSDGNWVEYILPKSNYAALANINIHIGDSLVGTSDIVVFNIMPTPTAIRVTCWCAALRIANGVCCPSLWSMPSTVAASVSWI